MRETTEPQPEERQETSAGVRARLAATSAAAGRSAGHVAIAVTVAILGFLLAIQLRAQEDLSSRLAVERESDLGQILTELTARSDALQDEIVDLRVRLESSSGSEEQERALLQNARQQLQALQILLGIVPVRGEGIVVTIADPHNEIGPEVLLDAVQELRDAGAEAIEVDGVRVVAQTAFTGTAGALQIGEATLAQPYVVKAIGASTTLAEAMRIPGGVVDTIGAREGASVRIEQRGSVSILSVAPLPAFENAQSRR